jgi:hypothetical protein
MTKLLYSMGYQGVNLLSTDAEGVKQDFAG